MRFLWFCPKMEAVALASKGNEVPIVPHEMEVVVEALEASTVLMTLLEMEVEG